MHRDLERRQAQIESEQVSGNAVFGLEVHGFDRIPESECRMRPRDASSFWVAANANVLFISFGVLALSLGLTVWQALLASLAGNLLFGYVAWGGIGGVRSSLPTLTFTRAVFGMVGNRLHGLFAWLTSVAFEVINTVLGVFAMLALFSQLGWNDPGSAGKIIGLVLVIGASAGLAYLGHATMVFMQRIFAVLLTITLVAVFANTIGGVDWGAKPDSPLSTGTTIALMLLGAGIVASGPLSYLFNTTDFVRYMPTRTRTRTAFWSVFVPAASMALFLTSMGVLLGSQGDLTDPVAGVEGLVPRWLYQATLLDAVVSSFVIAYVLFVSDFLSVLNDFIAVMIIWIGPFAGVWIIDGVMRGWRYDAGAVHNLTTRERNPYWGWRGWRLKALAAWASGALVGALTMNAPFYTSPVAKQLSGADLSWLLGFAVAGSAYWLLARADVAAERSLPAPAGHAPSSNGIAAAARGAVATKA